MRKNEMCLNILICVVEKRDWINFVLRSLPFGRSLLVCPIEHVKNRCAKPKSTSDWETSRNIAFCLYYLNKTCSFHLLICFHQRFLQWNFFSLNVVWMCKTRCVLKQNFHASDASVKRFSEEYAESIDFYWK